MADKKEMWGAFNEHGQLICQGEDKTLVKIAAEVALCFQSGTYEIRRIKDDTGSAKSKGKKRVH